MITVQPHDPNLKSKLYVVGRQSGNIRFDQSVVGRQLKKAEFQGFGLWLGGSLVMWIGGNYLYNQGL